MIDVPVEVKDALRDGRLKKNYRINVLENRESPENTENLNNYAWTSVTQTGIYRFSCSNANIDIGIRIGIDGGGYWPADPTATEFTKDFYIEEGANIMAYSPDLDPGDAFMKLIFNPDMPLFTIDNDNLVSESVSIDERMNSGDKIKFGLCEGASLEFQYFGLPSILGKRLQVFIDVDYGADEPYIIPMGFFDVKKCSRQASTGIIKVTAYNKLMSEYLDAKANELIESTFSDPTQTVRVYDIKYLLLQEFAITPYEETTIPPHQYTDYYHFDDATTTRYRDLQSLQNDYLGDKGPLNPKDIREIYWRQDPAAIIKLYIETMCRYYTLDPTKYYRLDSLYDLDVFENSFYDYLHELIDLAKYTVNADTFMNNLISGASGEIPATTVQGWKHIFAIILIKPDDSYDVFSLYANNRVRSMGELCKTLITGYKSMEIWTPTQIGNYWLEGTNVAVNPLVNFYGDDITYEYYVSDTGSVPVRYITDFNTHPSFKYPDGKTIKNELPREISNFISLVNVQDIEDIDLTTIDTDNLPDVTLRDLQSAVFESLCQFGQLSRLTDLFSGVELNHSRLYPQETLYPDNALYPDGAQGSANKSMYSKLWADEGNVHKWRNLIITYKGLDENQQEKDFVYETEINADGTDDYDCSDNWLFRNLVWTAEQIEEYAEAMAAKMQDMTWFPFEMWCAGLPYLETGDEIEIPMGENSYTSYILQRQLKGIQNLQDTYINGNLDIF